MSSKQETANEEPMVLPVRGSITATNAHEFEAQITRSGLAGHPGPIELDCKELSFISSAGLRVLLKLLKQRPDLRIFNVSQDVYEVFDMTGFTEMARVDRKMRRISVEGCEVIGEGANGKVYRIDPETIVKVYFDPDSLPDIEHERELARTAFVMGLPTAIPYDVVRVDESYGSVFELLNADSFCQLLIDGKMSVDEVCEQSAGLLHLIHATEVNSDLLPNRIDSLKKRVSDLRGIVGDELWEKIHSLVEALPEDHHMIHGDFHVKNVMVQDGECLLIDMDTLSIGHPLFELSGMYDAYLGFTELDHDNLMQFMGIPYETGEELFYGTLKRYFAERSEEELNAILNKVMIPSYVRMAVRFSREDSEHARAMTKCAIAHLEELVPQVDSLLF